MLRQAIRANKIRNARKELEPMLQRREEIQEALKASADELNDELREFTTEELEEIEQACEVLVAEQEELKTKIDELEEIIAGLEEENAAEVEEVEEAVEEEAPVEPVREEKRGEQPMNKRQQRMAYLNQDNVREFYERMSDVVKTRAITNADLLIPREVIDEISPLVAKESKFYAEVNVVRLNGEARAILEGADPEAIWTEMCDAVEELETAFNAVELDGYKVGGYIPVCNAVLEDSLINLADYVEKKLATAIAKALDKAIIAGDGTKQPVGITNGLEATALADNKLNSILATMGALKDDNLGEVKLAMRRADYFAYVFNQLVGETAAGQMVMPNVSQPNVAGLPVIFTEHMPEGTFVIGDFKKYILGERSGNRFEVSRDAQFVQDNTLFKMTARYDGKPVDADYFGYYSFVPGA